MNGRDCLRPDEVAAYKKTLIPKEVFDAFNELIAEKWDGVRAVVLQDDAIARILSKLRTKTKTEIDRGTVFVNGWLNVEESYRDAGWQVNYDKPAYYESYATKFTFTIKL